MFPRSRKARKTILLAAQAGDLTAAAKRAVGQTGSLAKVLRDSTGLRRCASQARVVSIKCSRKQRKIEPGRDSELRIGALGRQSATLEEAQPGYPVGRVIVDARTTIPGSVTHRNHTGGL